MFFKKLKKMSRDPNEMEATLAMQSDSNTQGGKLKG